MKNDRLILLAAAALGLAAAVAYHNSFTVPFLFDDFPSIVENPTIRRLWPVGDVLFPQHLGGLTASGRPLVNLSLAINYALGGKAPWGYHAINLLIHVLAGLTLFGVVRRTALKPVLAGRFGAVALPLALTVAAIWTLHPLQTESVTYLVQRTEALMGLCYLLTLYCFIRGAEASASWRSGFTPRFDKREDVPSRHKAAPTAHERWTIARVGWLALSVTACLLGMASKEVMGSAPVIVFLYDRTLVAGTFREAWRRRWPYYLGLAGTWCVLAWLVAGTEGRGGSAGFHTTVSSWTYALTQCRAVVLYLQLAIWPHPLVFDYGKATVQSLAQVWPQALLLATLVMATIWTLWRRPVWGLLGAWFFAILAPSSSVVPVATQTMAEHRMYLSLAAVVALAAAGLQVWLGRRAWVAGAAIAFACGWLTLQRNQDYRSEFAIWADTMAKLPANERAHVSLGNIYADREQWAEAMAQYHQALQIQPADASAHNNLGTALLGAGRPSEALTEFEQAERIDPSDASTQKNLGNSYSKKEQWAEAIIHFERALRIQPGEVDIHSNLATALVRAGRAADAVPHYEFVLQGQPGDAEVHHSLGVALMSAGRALEGMAQFEEALRIRPDMPEAERNLGLALVTVGKIAEAIPHFQQAVRLKPGYGEAEMQWAIALAVTNRFAEARSHFERALELDAGSVDLHYAFGRALLQAGRPDEAVAQFNEALRLNPNGAEAHLNLALALRELGRTDEAATHFREAARLNPNLSSGN